MQWSGLQSSTLGFLVIITFGCFIGAVLSALADPYKTLRVDKHANLQEIRKAYKQLAKEW